MKFKLNNDQINHIIEVYSDPTIDDVQEVREFISEVERRLNLLQLVETEEEFFEIVASFVSDSYDYSFDGINEIMIIGLARYYSSNRDVLQKLANRLGIGDPVESEEFEDETNYASKFGRHLGYGVHEGLLDEMDTTTDEEIAEYSQEMDENDIADENSLFKKLDFEDDERLRRQTKEDKINKRNGR